MQLDYKRLQTIQPFVNLWSCVGPYSLLPRVFQFIWSSLGLFFGEEEMHKNSLYQTLFNLLSKEMGPLKKALQEFAFALNCTTY